MKLLSMEDLLTVVFVLVDDWYQFQSYHKSQIGRREEMTNSEILTLMLAIDFMEFISERHYLEFVRGNYKHLFPKLLDQSQYNRRARCLIPILNALRIAWANDLGVASQKHFLLDTTPIVTVGYKRDKSHGDFLGSVNYGYCAARKLKYFGYKLVMLSTLDGLPAIFELVPANTDERAAADEVLNKIRPGSLVIGDKGFVGKDWQNTWPEIKILTQNRENQKEQLPKFVGRWINGLRERIEGLYKVAKEGGRSVEYNLAHTVEGMVSRILAKITVLTLRQYLREFLALLHNRPHN